MQQISSTGAGLLVRITVAMQCSLPMFCRTEARQLLYAKGYCSCNTRRRQGDRTAGPYRSSQHHATSEARDVIPTSPSLNLPLLSPYLLAALHIYTRDSYQSFYKLPVQGVLRALLQPHATTSDAASCEPSRARRCPPQDITVSVFAFASRCVRITSANSA